MRTKSRSLQVKGKYSTNWATPWNPGCVYEKGPQCYCSGTAWFSRSSGWGPSFFKPLWKSHHFCSWGIEDHMGALPNDPRPSFFLPTGKKEKQALKAAESAVLRSFDRKLALFSSGVLTTLLPGQVRGSADPPSPSQRATSIPWRALRTPVSGSCNRATKPSAPPLPPQVTLGLPGCKEPTPWGTH